VVLLVEILVECVGRVDRLVSCGVLVQVLTWQRTQGRLRFRCIFAGIFEDDLHATGMLGHELGNVYRMSISLIEGRETMEHTICTAMDDDPARLLIVMLCYVLSRQLHGLRVIAGNIHFPKAGLYMWGLRLYGGCVGGGGGSI